MTSVFITYAREDQTSAESISRDLEALGYVVWFDRELSGGQAWWEQVLAHIRESSTLLVLVTISSLKSQACRLEWDYASKLQRHVLPVVAGPDVDTELLPPALACFQFVDRRQDDKASLVSLLRALHRLPPATDLPDPLPVAPPVPLSYLGTVKAEVESSQELSRREQWDLVGRLKTALRESANKVVVLQLLRYLRGREDTYATIAAEVDEVLERFSAESEQRTSNHRPASTRMGATHSGALLQATQSPPKSVEPARPSIAELQGVQGGEGGKVADTREPDAVARNDQVGPVVRLPPDRLSLIRKRFLEQGTISRSEMQSLVVSLIESKADLNITERVRGNTLLHVAAREGWSDVAIILARSGAQITRRNGNGQRPVDVAADPTVASVLRITGDA